MLRHTAFLIVLLFIAVSQNCAAQKKAMADDVYDNDTTTTIKAGPSITDDLSYQIDDFVKGYIVMPTGDVLRGLLRFNGSAVIFKDTLTQKTNRYHAKDIKGFVTAVPDTLKTSYFELTKSIKLGVHPDKYANEVRYLARGPNGIFPADTFKVYIDTTQLVQGGDSPADTSVNYHFVKVMIYGSKLCLYKNVVTISNPRMMNNGMINGGMMNGGMINSRVMNGIMMRSGIPIPGSISTFNKFYIKRNNEIKYTALPSGKRAFRKLMASYLKDDAALVNDIDKGILTYSMIDQIVDRYNQTKNAE